MNEHEIRDALRGVMVASSPPPMNPQAALELARKAHRRRRTTLAATGATLAVVLVTASVFVAPGLSNLRPGQLDLGAPAGTGVLTDRAQPPPSGLPVSPPGGETETVWPTGPDGQPQSDRTAHAGPRHEQAARLLDELIAVVPPGYTIPEHTNLQPTGQDYDTAIRYWSRAHQAQFRERVDGHEVWEYLASLSVSRGGGTGRLEVEVITAPNQLPTDSCKLAKMVVPDPGKCELVGLGGIKVAMVAPPRQAPNDVDQLAIYRHPDGTVVTVSQGAQFYEQAEPALPGLPLDTRRLAELAADPRFQPA
jgi:hypothetical protein